MFRLYPLEKRIVITRGDAGTVMLGITVGGTPYVFTPGDVVELNVYNRKNNPINIISKRVTCSEETEQIGIPLVGEDTRSVPAIAKELTFYWEATLNPDTNPETFIGWDDNTGGKEFIILPEGVEQE